MRVKTIKFLSDYKQFKKGQLFHFSSDKKGITGHSKSNFSVLVGRNGSGKTTLMSLIPTLFHYIERYNGKIPADFELTYIVNQPNSDIEVKISHFENLIRVTVPNRFKNVQVVPRRTPNTNDFSVINRKEPYIHCFMNTHHWLLFHQHSLYTENILLQDHLIIKGIKLFLTNQ